ncbi:MAG: KUP/HAK/KT family potassium transporter, partial [Geobacteraceae bacterium]|nr:KUP/HAK/KT family potassium transporter [Geobacteraceae bacterium]
MGLVFGDIGTSPIYTLTVIFALTRPTPENVFGILSLVFWTMTILVTVEYAWLAMSLGRKGQGGEIVLREILIRLLKKGRMLAFAGLLSFIGVSLLLGDGVITPAISIMSAVEGMLLIPGFESLPQGALILIAIVIAAVLFVMQYKGTDKVAGVFGPVMVVWFITLTLTGLVSLVKMPNVVFAISPHYAIQFFLDNGLSAFFVLSEVILCATGGEALYADMGHLGRKPIIRAWYFVFAALIINYLGQGSFILRHPEMKNLLFGMVQSQAPSMYIPFLILTIMATIIASQAVISGVFSIVYQGLTTRLMPLMKIDYTSHVMKSQIYIGFINWTLMCAVIFIMLIFQKSANLAAAYGMAVTGSMTITSLMMIMIFAQTNKKWKVPIAVAVCCLDFIYLCSTFTKLPHGAYWSIILASFPLVTILIWTNGQRNLYRALKPLDIETFKVSY